MGCCAQAKLLLYLLLHWLVLLFDFHFRNNLMNHGVLLSMCVDKSFVCLNLSRMIMLAISIIYIYLPIPCLLPKDIGGASHVLE